ncbi:unnamed protein product [Prorocentrum cordatum]|uniref:FAD-binding FR-type domain-containing protein n=1 Tax=Prorocentrum cordatum TaxID=2364126 RepID=A0ABN9V5U5_9DINO|nr:unnamed protein product [Polarella glacialis]
MEKLVEQVDGVVVSSLQRQLGKAKWAARREEDAEVRKQLMAEAFEALEKGSANGGLDAITAPQLRSELLVMRSRQLIKSQPEAALSDAREARELKPSWGQARLALCGALEAGGLFTDALAELKEAQRLGGSVDAGSLRRQMIRLERKAATEVRASPPTAPREAAAAPEAPAARPEPSAAGAATPPGAAAGAAPPAAAPCEELPELLEWEIDGIARLSHDCIEVRLHCQDQALLARQCVDHAPTDTWHVDLLAEGGQLQEQVRRSYTPVSTGKDYIDGTLVLMLKVYPKGKMSRHLASLRPASTVLVSAPHPTIDVEPFSKGMLMIAGGSAVTVGIQAGIEGSRGLLLLIPPPRLPPVLCNHTAADVLYQERLEELMRCSPAFRVVHCLSAGGAPAGPSRATWRSGLIGWDAVGGALAGERPRAVLSGPRGLLRASLDMLVGQGWGRDRVRVLDDLPEEALGGGEALGLPQVPDRGGVRRRAGPGEEDPGGGAAGPLPRGRRAAAEGRAPGGGAAGRAGQGALGRPRLRAPLRARLPAALRREEPGGRGERRRVRCRSARLSSA